MLEAEYQLGLISRLEQRFPGIIVQVSNPRQPDYIQGWPDLILLYKRHWAALEVKASAKSIIQPNQRYYIDLLSQSTLALFVYPENEKEVLDALQHAFAPCGHSCSFESESERLDQL